MAKRSAANELNHDNWSQEEEPEKAGVFQRATAETLKDRKIRTARRRGVTTAGSESIKELEDQSGGQNLFAGFSGFKKAEPIAAKAVFSFLAAKAETGLADGSSASTSTIDNEKRTANGVDSVSDNTLKSNDYYRRLRGLNESVGKWISYHVAKNPFIILTPVFRDYEKHLASIQEKDNCKAMESITNLEGSSNETPVGSSGVDSRTKEEKTPLTACIFGAASNSASPTTASFSFGSSGVANLGQTQFCFGSSSVSNTSGGTPTFSFGSGSTTSPSAGFSFGAAKPFTFSNVVSNSTDEKKEDGNEDEEDESPPKPDHKPVNEEGATYTKRCKVFIKQGKKYSDRGIGNLFLKPVNEGKTQLIVRADTSLGNVLLNILVGSSLPVQRLGVNNIAVVCLPTPESEPPPVTVLLRVKTKDDADELFSTLEEHKKKAS